MQRLDLQLEDDTLSFASLPIPCQQKNRDSIDPKERPFHQAGVTTSLFKPTVAKPEILRSTSGLHISTQRPILVRSTSLPEVLFLDTQVLFIVSDISNILFTICSFLQTYRACRIRIQAA